MFTPRRLLELNFPRTKLNVELEKVAGAIPMNINSWRWSGAFPCGQYVRKVKYL